MPMPLNAIIGWTSEEDDKLVEHIEPHSFLYNIEDPSRKNILAREDTWKEISADLSKPVEECKKRWRCLRDSYMRKKRQGNTRTNPISDRLKFLDMQMESFEVDFAENLPDKTTVAGIADGNMEEAEQDVIVDNQNYYEITFMQDSNAKDVKKETLEDNGESVAKKKRGGGRRKKTPILKTSMPVKILPKPELLSNRLVPQTTNGQIQPRKPVLLSNRVLNQTTNGQIQQRVLPRLTPLVQEPIKMTNIQDSRSSTMDKLIEKVLSENTNEIDIFFRSMAASVKKLKPSLIPKVKMEVCNVIAKYEIQNAEQHSN